jgi:GTPase SAR1 family protein
MRNVIRQVKGSQPAPILLVANKLDLECQREISTEEGKNENISEMKLKRSIFCQRFFR